jgi:hypothetical protein
MLSEEQIMDYVQATRKVSEKKQYKYDEAKQIGDNLGIPWDTFDAQQFRIGLNIELEHGRKNPQTRAKHDMSLLTGKIALAHLKEFPDYYTRLVAMEEGAERAKGAQQRGDR